jgi:hypothetical protein
MTKPRYFPTARGWAALLIPLVGGFLFLLSLPNRFIASRAGGFFGGPVSPLAWVLGGLVIFLSAAACIEAFRRGCWTDRIIACLATLLTFWLIREFLTVFLLPVGHPPAASGNGAVALLFHVGRLGRAVPEQRCCAKSGTVNCVSHDGGVIFKDPWGAAYLYECPGKHAALG